MKNAFKLLKNIYLSKIYKSPYKLNFAITSACNSRCKTCNIGRLYQKNPKISKNDLSLKEIEKFFESLPPTISWLSLSGGEPFLRKDLPQIIHSASQKIKNLTLMSIPSNGLLTKQIVKMTKRILFENPNIDFYINFSIDGPRDIHNKIRGLRGFDNTWHTYKKIKNLMKRFSNLDVGIETTISKFNFNKLDGFFRTFSDKQTITTTIAHKGYLYRNQKNDDDFTLSNNKNELKWVKTVLDKILKRLKWSKPAELIEYLYLKKIPYFLESKKIPLPCAALVSSIALDSKGNIIPCFMWNQKITNIKKENFHFNILWNSTKVNKLRKIILSQKCPRCWTPCEAYQAIIKQITNMNFIGLFHSPAQKR